MKSAKSVSAIPITALCFALLAPCRVSGQIMSGELRDAAGTAPVPLHEVRLVRVTGATSVVVDSLHTNTKGRFEFSQFGAGVYQLRVGPRNMEYLDAQMDTIVAGDVTFRVVRLPAAFWEVDVPITIDVSVVDAKFDIGGRGPAYPTSAFRQGLNGLVLAFVTVGTDGRVSQPDIRSTDKLFTPAAREWLSRLRMLPASRGAIAIPQTMCLQIMFLVGSNARVLPKVTSMPDLTANAEERALAPIDRGSMR